MINTEYIREKLQAPNLSDAYVDKYIKAANGDINKLDDLLITKKVERDTTVAIREVR